MGEVNVSAMPAENRKMAAELIRILWRQQMLATPEGLAFLVSVARRKEQDVGPNSRWSVKKE